MEQAHNTEQRLIDLEIKASFTEDLLDKLDQVIIRQQQQLDSLIREIADLRQPAKDDGVGIGAPRSLREEMPPHF